MTRTGELTKSRPGARRSIDLTQTSIRRKKYLDTSINLPDAGLLLVIEGGALLSSPFICEAGKPSSRLSFYSRTIKLCFSFFVPLSRQERGIHSQWRIT
mmetsp:Transcript_53042/g.103777  ORF Transcript_53042/g.103777 Transcript_53042/m.103777 type:complete len:99 (+) Transcript_53042:217-513(+)